MLRREGKEQPGFLETNDPGSGNWIFHPGFSVSSWGCKCIETAQNVYSVAVEESSAPKHLAEVWFGRGTCYSVSFASLYIAKKWDKRESAYISIKEDGKRLEEFKTKNR